MQSRAQERLDRTLQKQRGAQADQDRTLHNERRLAGDG